MTVPKPASPSPTTAAAKWWPVSMAARSPPTAAPCCCARPNSDGCRAAVRRLLPRSPPTRARNTACGSWSPNASPGAGISHDQLRSDPLLALLPRRQTPPPPPRPRQSRCRQEHAQPSRANPGRRRRAKPLQTRHQCGRPSASLYVQSQPRQPERIVLISTCSDASTKGPATPIPVSIWFRPRSQSTGKALYAAYSSHSDQTLCFSRSRTVYWKRCGGWGWPLKARVESTGARIFQSSGSVSGERPI